MKASLFLRCLTAILPATNSLVHCSTKCASPQQQCSILVAFEKDDFIDIPDLDAKWSTIQQAFLQNQINPRTANDIKHAIIKMIKNPEEISPERFNKLAKEYEINHPYITDENIKECESSAYALDHLLAPYIHDKDRLKKVLLQQFQEQPFYNTVALFGKKEHCALVCDAGFDLTTIKGINYNGYTPLHFAVYFNDQDKTMFLLNYINPNATAGTNITPLHVAASKNNPTMINLLVNYNNSFFRRLLWYYQPNITAQDSAGNTAIHLGINDCQQQQVPVIVSHLAHHQDFPQIISTPNNDGYTPLHLAVLKKNKPLVELLMKMDAQPFAPTKTSKGEPVRTPAVLAQNIAYSQTYDEASTHVREIYFIVNKMIRQS